MESIFPVLPLILLVLLYYFVKSRFASPKGRKKSATNLPRRRGHVEKFPGNFVVFDLETTGLSAQKNKIIEIAALKVSNNGEIIGTYQTLVKIKSALPKKITDLTGITKKMLDQDGVLIDDAVSGFLRFSEGLPLAAYNAPFDIGFLEAEAARCGLSVESDHFCILQAARKIWPGRSSYSLSNLSRDIGLGVQSHRALDDCKMALSVYLKMAEANA